MPAGTLLSPQGITEDASGTGFFVADYTGGLWHLVAASGALMRLAAAPDVNVYGIDGLYRHGAALIAVQNGHRPHRVTRLTLSDDGRQVSGQSFLAAGLPEFDDPTLGTIIGGRFHFVANSHWPAFGPDKSLPDGLSPPLIMAVELPR